MTAPQIFESTDDGYSCFFRLDAIEEEEGGRVYVGVTRSGGITKGTDPTNPARPGVRREWNLAPGCAPREVSAWWATDGQPADM